MSAPKPFGEERRAENREFGWRLGRWLLRHSRTWAAIVVAHFALLGLIAFGTVITARSSSDAVRRLEAQVARQTAVAEDARAVARFVEQCMQRVDELTTRERREECGPADAAFRAVAALVDFNSCALLILPEDRTPEQLDACARQALAR